MFWDGDNSIGTVKHSYETYKAAIPAARTYFDWRVAPALVSPAAAK
jgi:hypothetical protein